MVQIHLKNMGSICGSPQVDEESTATEIARNSRKKDDDIDAASNHSPASNVPESPSNDVHSEPSTSNINQNPPDSSKQRLLFVCVANSCRSQLAEALGRRHLADLYEIHSAGSAPTKPNELAIAFLNSKGHDTSGLYSKAIADIPKPIHIIITLCDEGDAECASYFDSNILSRKFWPQQDPSKMESKDEVMKQMDTVYKNIEKLVLDLRKETLDSVDFV